MRRKNAEMRRKNAPRVTIENVTFVRFRPTDAPVETAREVELRLIALSHAAENRQLRMELELALRLIAWAQRTNSGTAYEAVCAELRDQTAGSADSSQASPRALETF
jgi:hypothetical protein